MSQHPKLSQAAALPYRLDRHGGVHVVLIRTRSGRWGIPKGNILPGESLEQAAAREAYEEAGVRGSIIGPAIGTFCYRRSGVTRCRVAVYTLRVERTVSRWPEDEVRRRAWVTLAEACQLIARPALKQVVRSFELPELPAVARLRTAV